MTQTGTVKFFDGQRGFGFITVSDGGNDVFVHISNVVGGASTPLAEGQSVEFETGAGRKGPEALNVRPV